MSSRLTSTVMFDMKIIKAVGSLSRLFWIVMGFLLLFVIGVLDYFSGSEISLSLFYVFPIAFIARVGDWKYGLISAIVSAVIWLSVEILVGTPYSHPAILYWNGLVRLSMFLLMAYSIKLGRSLERETIVARTDFLTGAVNGRYFNELLEMEVQRVRRYPHPFTLVYIDIDNFKLVNDLFGHQKGDELLRSIASELKSHLRSTDIIARLGGDEFVMLLPSARQPEARLVISKVLPNLANAMKNGKWPVTFSMGAVTCVAPPHSAEQIIKMADDLMYEVKNSTKNDIRYATYRGGRSLEIEGRMTKT